MDKRVERLYIRVTHELKQQVRQLAKREGRESLANTCEVLIRLGLHVKQFDMERCLDVPLDDD